VSAQSGQPFPYAQPGNGPFNAPTGAPVSGGFNAAPTLANAPANTWHNSAIPAGQRPPATPPIVPAFTGYANQAQPPRPFPTPPAIPTTNGYIGLTQNQQPFPNTPPFFPGVQAGFTGNQPEPSAGLVPPGNPLADANAPGNSLNNAARKRLRRNGLRTSGEHMAFAEQISGEYSADMMEVSDPYPRAVRKQYSQKEQVAKQAPEESS